MLIYCCIVLLPTAGVAQSAKYDKVLRRIEDQRETLNLVEDSAERVRKASDLLLSSLADSIFPAWYGTPWDFNGISNVPGKGEIACGYFVSTTLKHIGFNLNRYKVAQQAASVIVETICGRANVNSYKTKEAAILHCRKEGKGLFIVGLSNHVGYLLCDGKGVYFIHSDYVSDSVKRELAVTSEAFNASSVFVVGYITENNHLINGWLARKKMY